MAVGGVIGWLDDLGKDDSQRVGKKCANLGELRRAGFRVPPGFALSLEAYELFMNDSGAGEELTAYFADFRADPDEPRELAAFSEASSTARTIVENRPLPADLESAIAEHYEQLSRMCAREDVAVAARSAGAASHPGQYESYLSARGRATVLENVVKVWSSTFNTRSLIARARKGLPLESDPIGVAVLQMVDADAAGVMFTADPTTADATKVLVEGSRGLGEIVVSGAVIPDNWTVDATRFTITERRLSPTPPPDGEQGACLTDDEVVEIARIGKQIEKHFGKPQDIEWAIDRSLAPGGIFILQSRPETFRINFRF
jgi:pyruvate,water dikinase